MNLPTYTTIGVFILIVLLGALAIVKAAKFAALGNKLRATEEMLDYWRELATSRTAEVSKWRKLFGPFPSLYENSPEAERGPDHNDRTIAIDLDGVILRYVTPWNGVAHFGEAIPGAAEAIGNLKDLGYKIVIYTTRNNALAAINNGYNALELTALVQNELEKNNIPYDFIALFKPLARYYIDDRAIEFHSWPNVTYQVLNHERARLCARDHELERASRR